jgi:hypothetical protein
MQTPRAHRTVELVKEFARKGHDVTVYAVLGKYDYSDFEREFRVKVKNIKLKWQFHPYNSDADNKRNILDKITGRLLRKFEFPDVEFMFRMKQILKNEQETDLLISIANPHPIHWGCAKAKLKLKNDFPSTWVADCGDPFMKNGSGNKHLKCFSKFEKLFCLNADYIAVPHKGAIEAYYPEFRNKIKIIPQGFEFDLDTIKKTNETNQPISFAYAGVFLNDIRNPTGFFEYLTTIEKDFKFYVYTSHKGLLDKFKSVLNGKLIIKKSIPREKLMLELNKMDFLLNFENLNTPTAVPSKLIDYAITGRPILSINQENIKVNVIREFLNRNYQNALKIENLDQYHISKVASSFLNLARK